MGAGAGSGAGVEAATGEVALGGAAEVVCADKVAQEMTVAINANRKNLRFFIDGRPQGGIISELRGEYEKETEHWRFVGIPPNPPIWESASHCHETGCGEVSAYRFDMGGIQPGDKNSFGCASKCLPNYAGERKKSWRRISQERKLRS